MRRSRRVYQAPDSPDTSTASDADGSDETRPRKRNANNDPSQPLTGLHLESVENGSQQLHGDDGRAGSANDDETTNNSSIFARCLCCRRAQTGTDNVVGENRVFIVVRGSRIS